MDFSDFIRYGEEIAADRKLEHYRRVMAGLDEDAAEWFERNSHWIIDEWVLNERVRRRAIDPNIVVMVRPPERTRHPATGEEIATSAPELKTFEMQRFITRSGFGGGFLRAAEKKDILRYTEQKVREHMWDIARAAVFGLGMGGGGEIPPHMSGFVEQKGRLPRPADRIEIVHFENNYLEMIVDDHVHASLGELNREFAIRSECCIVAF